jgi:hypothetical protein
MPFGWAPYRQAGGCIPGYSSFYGRHQRERATRKTPSYRLRQFHYFGDFEPCLDSKCPDLEFPAGSTGESREKSAKLPSRSQSSAGGLNAFGIGAFALLHCPGEVPTISRKLRLKAG